MVIATVNGYLFTILDFWSYHLYRRSQHYGEDVSNRTTEIARHVEEQLERI